MPTATLHDGSTIDIEVHGTGPTLLLPVNPRPVEGPQADEMRKVGADPALGRSLIDGLSGQLRVAAFDYEGHVLAEPKPGTLTPANLAADLLAVADAVGAERFAYYGYSWLGLGGLQLAIRTDRLSALVMGGFPPIDGPYEEMLRVTAATHAMATAPTATATGGGDGGAKADAGWGDSGEIDWSSVEMTMSPAQTQQFLTLYEALRDFDDVAAQPRVTCPRLCVAGSADQIDYEERWGGVRVDIGGPLVRRRAELERLGWDVAVLDGLDHMRAMQAEHVLPILRPWLAAHV
ncbi:alpha/beta fold hydrolase [Nonomuraea sp. ZG12]|uniref:alpha/beta fold hydrolase n=1 Tax=Nonomuraea sp. ZG12 TaxID=3452207 RepID=UPI003F8AACBF